MIGAIVVLRFRIGLRPIGLIMGFGAGVLISALASALAIVLGTVLGRRDPLHARANRDARGIRARRHAVGVVTTLGFALAFAIHTLD